MASARGPQAWQTTAAAGEGTGYPRPPARPEPTLPDQTPPNPYYSGPQSAYTGSQPVHPGPYTGPQAAAYTGPQAAYPPPPPSMQHTGPTPAAPPSATPAWLWRLGLPVVLALQTALSLTLVWSNTAFGDEALYLWEGRLEWAHWLHNGPLPSFHNSGAPQIYPPIGAAAAAVGGVAGARLLSLLFMLAATALLYCIGVRLFGRGAALAAAALWAVSEPVLRLAFATYDPLSCLLIITGAWLAIRSVGCRPRRTVQLACASALILSLAALTASSFAILIPVVVAISFFAWADRSGWRTAAKLAGVQVLIAVLFAVIGITVLGQWHDLINTTVSRSGDGGLGQGVSLVIGNAWNWDGLLFCLAVAAAVAAVATHGLRHPKGLLVVTCALASVLVPVYQAHLGTGYSMDKHMSAGSGFAALAAGYGIARLRMRLALPATAAALSAGVLIAYPATTGAQAAQSMFRTWVNVSALVTSARQFDGKAPVLVHSGNGKLDINVLTYYLPQATFKTSAGVSVAAAIAHGKYSGIIVDMNASVAQATANAHEVTRDPKAVAAKLLSLEGKHSLIANIVSSHRYALVTVIPYQTADSLNGTGQFIVWRVTPPQKTAIRHHHHRTKKPRTKKPRA